MAIFSWNEKYRVGYTQIDAQHMRLFELAGRLHRAMAAGNGRAALAPALEELISYTRSHFNTEESLMRSARFPGYEAHRAAHHALATQVLQFQQEFAEGRVAVDVKMLSFVKKWLVGHIGTEDTALGAWLKQRAA